MAVSETGPRSDRWERAVQAGAPELRGHYDRRRDCFFITLGSPHPAGSIQCEEGMLLRVDLETQEVIGLEIWDFQRVFLHKHPDIAELWQQAHNPLYRWLKRSLGRAAERLVTVRAAQETKRLCLSHGGLA